MKKGKNETPDNININAIISKRAKGKSRKSQRLSDFINANGKKSCKLWKEKRITFLINGPTASKRRAIKRKL